MSARSLAFAAVVMGFALSTGAQEIVYLPEGSTATTAAFYYDKETGDAFGVLYDTCTASTGTAPLLGTSMTTTKCTFSTSGTWYTDEQMLDAVGCFTRAETAMLKAAPTLTPANKTANMTSWMLWYLSYVEQFREVKQEALQAYAEHKAKQATEDRSGEAAEAHTAAITAMSIINAKVATVVPALASNIETLITNANTALTTAKDDLKKQLADIKSKLDSGEGTTGEDTTKTAELAEAVAALELAIGDATQLKGTMVSNIKAASDAVGVVSQQIVSVTQWLGGGDKVSGETSTWGFRPPVSPILDARYSVENGDNINNYLGDVGVVSYLTAEQMSKTGTPPALKYSYRFYEQEQSGVTNVVATFKAPKNWADGVSVFCTDGVYRVKEPVTWITNITENIDARTAITNIFNNIDARTFITNITLDVDQRTFVTNLTQNIDNRTFVTNIVFNEDNRTFITNIVQNIDARTAITNIFVTEDNRTFVTNLVQNIDNRQFVTNIVFNEDNRSYVTNLVQNIDARTFLTNITHNADNRSFVTNIVINYGDSITNVYYILGVPSKDDIVGPNPPKPKPEDDPYNIDYIPPEPDDPWANFLPPKNARNIVAITNALFGVTNDFTHNVNMASVIDFQSLNTNNLAQTIQIAGFDAVSETNYFPVTSLGKDASGNEVMTLTWREVWTTNALTEKEYQMIKKLMEFHTNHVEMGWLISFTTNINWRFGELTTNFFSEVKAETLLDNASVWTNGAKKVEVKGFGDAGVNTVPMVTEDEGGNKGLRWLYFPGTDASSDVEMSGAEYSSLDYLHNYAGVDPGKHKNGGTNVLTIAGFPIALDLTVPTVRRDNETGARDLEWNPYYEPDSAVTGDVSPGKSLVASAVEGSDSRPHTAVSLYGFDTAETDTVPTVAKDSDGNRYLEWRGLKGATDVRPFALNSNNTQMVNCYYNLSGVTYRMGDQAVPSGSGIVYLKVMLSGSIPVASVGQVSDLEALNAEERRYDQYVFPLYVFGGNGLEADLRSMPAAPVYMNTTR